MSDPTLIADLVRAGVDAELVGRVSNALVTETAVAALRVTHASRDASRHEPVLSQTPGAIRARRARANRKQNQGGAKANDVAQPGAEPRDSERDASRDGVTGASTFLPSFASNEAGLSEEVGKQKKKEGTEIARARGNRMQPGAPLTEDFRQAAIKLGAPPDVIDEMWVEHVDYWVGVPGERGVKTQPNGWIATWRNDVRRKLKMGTYNGKARQGSGSAGGSGFSGIALARARAAGEHH